MVFSRGNSIALKALSTIRYAPAQKVTHSNHEADVEKGSACATERIPMDIRAPRYQTSVKPRRRAGGSPRTGVAELPWRLRSIGCSNSRHPYIAGSAKLWAGSGFRIRSRSSARRRVERLPVRIETEDLDGNVVSIGNRAPAPGDRCHLQGPPSAVRPPPTRISRTYIAGVATSESSTEMHSAPITAIAKGLSMSAPLPTP